MVRNLYPDMGFDLVTEGPDGTADYQLDITRFRERVTEIEILRRAHGHD
jgi:hypothetical protein